MAFQPIAYTMPQYENYVNWWLKPYIPGGTTPKAMATDSTGATQASRFEINVDGFPKTAGGALVIPNIDGAYDLFLFPTKEEADANDTTNALKFADNILGPLSVAIFDGADPTLANNISAISWGATDTVSDPHMAAGPTLIQAKTTELLAAQLNLNTLGGDVQLGTGIKASGQFLSGWNAGAFGTLKLSATGPGLQTQIGEPSTGFYLEVGGGSLEATNSSFPIFDVASTTFRVTHPSATTTLTRALSIPDLFSVPLLDATTPSITMDAGWIGPSTEITASGVTVTLNTDIGDDGDLIEFFFSDAGGGTFAFSTIAVRFATLTIPQGKYVLLKKRSSGNYDMIGFK